MKTYDYDEEDYDDDEAYGCDGDVEAEIYRIAELQDHWGDLGDAIIFSWDGDSLSQIATGIDEDKLEIFIRARLLEHLQTEGLIGSDLALAKAVVADYDGDLEDSKAAKIAVEEMFQKRVKEREVLADDEGEEEKEIIVEVEL